MNLHILIASTALLFAGAAQAQTAGLPVSLIGKTPSAISAEVLAASKVVCKPAADETLYQPGDFDHCVAAAYRTAMLQVTRNARTRAPELTRVASR